MYLLSFKDLSNTKVEIFISSYSCSLKYGICAADNLQKEVILKKIFTYRKSLYDDSYHNKKCDNLCDVDKCIFVLILTIEFPNIDHENVKKHILNYKKYNHNLSCEFHDIIRTPFTVEHERYMNYIHDIMSDIIVDFNTGTYSINFKLPLIKVLNKIILDYYGDTNRLSHFRFPF